MLTTLRSRRAGRRTDERGAIVVVTALTTCFVLILVAALTVDIGNTWARRGQLQSQADKAAIFAANYLPAGQAATKLTAAKAAVHYIACNPVAGQEASVNSDFPIPRDADGDFVCDNPSFDSSASTYTSAATSLMANGSITFPNRYEISVRTPWAKVDYGFGKVAGVEDSVQYKTASAHVYSPGNMVPMGGSIGCAAAAANNTAVGGLGDVLSSMVPVNYFSAGNGANASVSGGAGSGVTWPGTPVQAPDPGPPSLKVTSAAVTGTQVTVAYTTTHALTGLLPGVLALIQTHLVSTGVTVWFGRGTSRYTVSAPISAVGTVLPVTLPAAVQAAPGEWHLKIVAPIPTSVFLGIPSYQNRQSSNDVIINVGASGLDDLTNLDNFLSCAKPIVSPRTPAGTASQDMIDNIRRGMDHNLSQHPSLVTAAQGLGSLASMPLSDFVVNGVNDPSKLGFDCSTDTASVNDTSINASNSPNCVRIDTIGSWDYEFTQGFLTQNGRLSCDVANCDNDTFSGSEFGLAGEYNNDEIADFISDPDAQSVLDDMLFTSLDTLLTPSIPVLTPADTLSSDLYGSPRFFWAPVLTTVYTTGTDASYPILTFRPAFITQENPTMGILEQLLDSLAIETKVELELLISGGITGLVSGTLLAAIQAAIGLDLSVNDVMALLGDTDNEEKFGLVVDMSAPTDSRLKALRVMNINPGALPAVDPNYSGPVSDYFGSGPRVIRLVE